MIFEFLEKCNFDDNSVILEIGAHMGFDTERIKSKIGNARFYAFEPDSRNINILRDRGIDGIANIITKAVSNQDGVMKLYRSGGKIPDPTGNEFYDNNEWTASNSLREPNKHLEVFPWCDFDDSISDVVDTIRLDTFCKSHDINDVNFIWMDVQGCEDLVFRGAQSMLERTEYIYTEYSNEELYKGQMDLDSLIGMLPGEWVIRNNYGGDVLLENVTYRDSLLTKTGSWTVKNMNEHAFDEPLAIAVSTFMLYENLSTCLDFGCGPGEYVKHFRSIGIDSNGYDGNIHTPELTDGLCKVLDLTTDFDLGTVDVVLCLEVGEHVPAEYEHKLLDNLTKHSSNLIVLSWGVPEQGGYGHVNCQENQYIKDQLKLRGFESVDTLENIFRVASRMTWFHNTIMVFKKKK